MNTRRIITLAIATAVLVAATILALNYRERGVADAALGAPFFPGLATKANDIARVEIVKGRETVTLVRAGEGWTVAERNNYAADVAVLRPLVLELSQLKTVEAKTSKPDQYQKLGVEDPAGEDAASTGVTLKDAQGQVLASAVLGMNRDSDDGAKKMSYARRSGEAQAWLVEGQVNVPVEPRVWLSKEIVIDIFSSRIKSYSVSLPEGDRYLIARDKPDDKGFKYLPPPRTGKIRSQARLDDMAGALEHVTPLDVFPATAFPLDPAKVAKNEYRTFEGIVVKTTLQEKEGKTYVAYEVSADAAVTDTGKQEAQAIAGKVNGWVFEIPDARAALMTKKNSDVLAPN